MSNQSSSPNKLIAVGFATIGLGYLYELFRDGSREVSPLGRNGLGRLPRKGEAPPLVVKSGVREIKFYPAGDIAHRVGFIADQIRKDSTDKAVITEARAIVSGKCPTARGGRLDWCVQPKDWKGELAALYNAITDPNSALAVRYTRDHATVDLFGSSALLRRLPSGDCDDLTIRLGALARAIGYSVKCRVVAPAGQPDQWAHIYIMVGNEPGNPKPSKWYSLDASEPQHPAFWEVPSHLISTKRDFEV
jgi:hypothetical protein